MMHVSFSSTDIYIGKYDGLVVFTYEDRSDAEARFVEKIGRNLPVARERREFEGKPSQAFLETQPATPRFAAIIGLGKRSEVSADRIRAAAGSAAAALRDRGAKHLAFEVPQELDAADAAQAVTEGAMLGAYRFKRYKTQRLDELREVAAITIVSDRTGMAARHGMERGQVIAESANYVRDLQNTAPADMTPAALADEAVLLAKRERLTVKVLDRKQLEKQGYGGILAVGQGSRNEPRLVTLEYAPKGAARTIAVVGKGITFDTGGISIKPAQGMALMKFDKSGACAVLGIMRNAARLRLPVRVIGIMALAENMPDGGAYRPGDVIRTKAGKTIEVDNTDAEGRIALADALHHATLYRPDMIVDLATLTGACVVALGDIAAAAMGNNQQAIDAVIAASQRSGEKVWQLPLWDEYEKDVESGVADIKNVGLPKMAGAISGAMLLKHFVGSTPWVHLDIAGVAWAEVRDRYFSRKGDGTAFGVRLVTELLRAA